MGVVYYTRYLEYFEAARTGLLKSIGVVVTDIENEGFFLPVVSAHCDYKQCAKFVDGITLQTCSTGLSRARITSGCEVI